MVRNQTLAGAAVYHHSCIPPRLRTFYVVAGPPQARLARFRIHMSMRRGREVAPRKVLTISAGAPVVVDIISAISATPDVNVHPSFLSASQRSSSVVQEGCLSDRDLASLSGWAVLTCQTESESGHEHHRACVRSRVCSAQQKDSATVVFAIGYPMSHGMHAQQGRPCLRTCPVTSCTGPRSQRTASCRRGHRRIRRPRAWRETCSLRYPSCHLCCHVQFPPCESLGLVNREVSA